MISLKPQVSYALRTMPALGLRPMAAAHRLQGMLDRCNGPDVASWRGVMIPAVTPPLCPRKGRRIVSGRQVRRIAPIT